MQLYGLSSVFWSPPIVMYPLRSHVGLPVLEEIFQFDSS